MSDFRTGWHLIYTRPRHEKQVHSRLVEMKINAFLPMRKVLRNWHDRKKYIDEPLFPSYVFVYLTDMRTYYEGINTEGALHYVRLGKKIAQVQDSVVESIRLLLGDGRDVQVSDSVFYPGQHLTISQGPLTGLSCEVVKVNDKQMLLVRVNLLQRNLLLQMPGEHLI